MSQRLTYTNWAEMPDELRASIIDRLLADLNDDDDLDAAVDLYFARLKQQPPLVRTGQGDFAQEWTPEPRAFVDRRTAIVGAVMLLAVAALAFLLLASLP